jgi:hypothetical protein
MPHRVPEKFAGKNILKVLQTDPRAAAQVNFLECEQKRLEDGIGDENEKEQHAGKNEEITPLVPVPEFDYTVEERGLEEIRCVHQLLPRPPTAARNQFKQSAHC